MAIENNYKLAFVDSAYSRVPVGRLTTGVYRKPMHTDQYLAYDSQHPQSIKRRIATCFYERVKRLVTKPSPLQGESVLVSNGYPLSFLQKITKTRKPSTSAKLTIEYNYPMSKAHPNNFAAAYNDKAYALF